MSQQQSQTPDRSEQEKKKLRFNLAMDLVLLRQVRGHGDAVFARGSPVFENVAQELSQFDKDNFFGITKKAVRDRVFLLLGQHRRNEEWNKKQSGTKEEFDEKTLLLTELNELYEDRDTLVNKQREDQQTEAQRAVVIRDNACKNLSKKQPTDADADADAGEENDAPAAKRRRSYGLPPSSSTESVVKYLREKQTAQQSLEQERLELERERLKLQKQELDQKQEREREEREARRRKEDDERREKLAMLTILERLADKLK